MQALPAADSQKQGVARSLTLLELTILAIGVLQFVLLPASVTRPLLAAGTLGGLALTIIGLRLLATVGRTAAALFLLDLVVMLTAVTLLALASGAARSALTPLYILPMAGATFAFVRWWAVLSLAALVAGLAFLLAAFTPDLEPRSAEFGVRLLSAVLPASAICLLLARMVDRMHHAARRIRDLSATDALTGLLNLRAFENVLQQEHRKAERFGRAYSILMVDVNNLKQINETLGYEAGSLVLDAVAGAITRSVRNSDVVARFGGDEFIVLCVESSSEIAAAVAQRIRHNVYACTVSAGNRLIRANVSVGVANFPSDHLYPKELMILAGQNMHEDGTQRRETETT